MGRVRSKIEKAVDSIVHPHSAPSLETDRVEAPKEIADVEKPAEAPQSEAAKGSEEKPALKQLPSKYDKFK